jgi:hypothetical protein
MPDRGGPPVGHRAVRRLAAGARRGAGLVLAWALGGCAAIQGGSAQTAAPLRVDPAAVLRQFDLRDTMDADTARSAQSAVRVARDEIADTLVRERIACYRKFLVNACLADVGRRDRLAASRLDDVEIAANQALREATALALNRRIAADIAEQARRGPDDAASHEENRRTFEARAASAAAAQAARERDAPELERQAQANRAERTRREADNAKRREEAARRATEDGANAKARAEAIEANRKRAEVREAQAKERSEANRIDAERRVTEQRERDARPPATKRPGSRAVPPAGPAPAQPLPGGMPPAGPTAPDRSAPPSPPASGAPATPLPGAPVVSRPPPAARP